MTDTKKIAYLVVHQSADLYGSDRVLLEVVKATLRDTNYAPVVVLPCDGPLIPELTSVGATVYIAPVGKLSRAALSPGGMVRFLFDLFKGVTFLRQVGKKHDVEFIVSNTLAVTAGAIYSLVFRVKHIWHVHEIILSPKVVSVMFPALAKYCADRVIAVSEAVAQWLVERQPTIAGKLDVVYNGLPAAERLTEPLGDFRRGIGVDEGVTLISLVGRINAWKGQLVLLKALKIMLESEVDAKNLVVAIVGDAAPGCEPLRQALKEFCTSNALDRHVRFIPFVREPYLVWRDTDIAVVPSTEPEPFGMVAIEAMQMAIPVVAAAHGGLKEIVVNGETGLLFSPGNETQLAAQLLLLVNDQSLRTSMGTRGRERQLARFTLDAQVIRLLQIYRKVTGSFTCQ